MNLTEKFTFHYELIITDWFWVYNDGSIQFTFHYELIITSVS